MLNRSITACLLIAVMLFSALLAGVQEEVATASPSQRAVQVAIAHQVTPDWMPPESAAQLDIGIDVLVPVSVPAPFSGVPQISASSGYYSLYWYVGGGDPTLLQITGTAGGEIPAYSKYDRNVELVANASVNGATAYHDVTPIYDLIYWQVGNVVYSVESQNSSVDSLSLANSLAVLAVPAQSTPLTATVMSPDQITAGNTGTVTVSVSGEATLSTDLGTFTATGATTISVSGDVSVEWQAPALADPATATFQVIDPSDGSVIASTPTQVLLAEEPTEAPEPSSVEWGLSCPTEAVEGGTVVVTAQGPQRATLSASDGTFRGGSPAIVVNLEGSVDVEFDLPLGGVSSVLLTLSDGESAVATCEIAVVSEGDIEPTATPTELPDGVFPGDATDLSVPTGEEPTLPEDFGTATPVPTKDPSKIEGDGTGIIEAANVTPPPVPPTPTPTKTPKPGEPTPTPKPTDTPAPTPTFTPENPIPTMVPQVANGGRLVASEIGPAGGQLDSPDYGVQIVVPEDTFSDVTSVTVQPIPDSQVPLQTNVNLVPESAFDISFAQMNGRGIDLGNKKATIRVDLGERWANGASLFQLVDGQANQLKSVSSDGTVLEAKIGGPMRIVAGVPTAQVATSSRSLVSFIIIALIAVILLIVAGSVLISLRSRRPRTVVTRRNSGSRSRF